MCRLFDIMYCIYCYLFPGQENLRKLWQHYFDNCQAVVFFVSAADGPERLKVAKQELHKMLDNLKLKNKPLLLFANKQDLPGALPASEIEERMCLNTVTGRKWKCQGCSIKSGEGLSEGISWLTSNLK